jgi:Mg2+ and Co2+ transporter CorA
MNPIASTEKRIMKIIQAVNENTNMINEKYDMYLEMSSTEISQYINEVIEEVQSYGLLKGP